MKKIPTVFVRSEADRRFVTPEINPGCEWVFADPVAVPTRKYDGTCVMLDSGGKWWARREVKAGKPFPAEFQESEHDEVTGKSVGWEPMEQSGFARWHAEALASHPGGLDPGTYELAGPRINGNPEGYGVHQLVAHATAQEIPGVPTGFADLAAFMSALPYEGIVWHHPDGRMAKLKRRDFPRGEE